jgi:carbonic anhydrase/acetyltransferase-like protein (isoleucine patch superfamily)
MASLFPYEEWTPRVAADAFIAPSAQLIGNVQIGSQSSIWYGCILRGDVDQIVVGDRSNLQDGTIVHVSPGDPTRIGSDVLVGHGAILHGCELQNGSFVGIRATILNRVLVESGAFVAAGALVLPGTLVPSGEMWGGAPAKKIAPLTQSLASAMKLAAAEYVVLGQKHGARKVSSS